MKTPDEIKKELEYLSITNVAEKVEKAKRGLPYAYTEEVAADALAYIQQLESDKQQLEGLCNHMNQLRDAAAGRALKLETKCRQLERERDAAVDDMTTVIYNGAEIVCQFCKHRDEHKCAQICGFTFRSFEWRGVKEE